MHQTLTRLEDPKLLEDQTVITAFSQNVVIDQVTAVVNIRRRPADIHHDERVSHIESLVDTREGTVDDVWGGEDLVGCNAVKLFDILFPHDIRLIEVRQIAFQRLFPDLQFVGDHILQYDKIFNIFLQEGHTFLRTYIDDILVIHLLQILQQFFIEDVLHTVDPSYNYDHIDHFRRNRLLLYFGIQYRIDDIDTRIERDIDGILQAERVGQPDDQCTESAIG